LLPTESELQILEVLWSHGPATVREVHERLTRAQETAYTTTLKLLQIMHEKGLVKRDESDRAHVYTARVERDATERRLISDLARRAFGGSAARLVMRALSDQVTEPAELKRIGELLDRLEREGNS
jgi:predicted transcriptional regulator